MSDGLACSCPLPRAKARANWRIVQYRCNHSAFNGYQFTPSDYSAIICLICRHSWRTRAAYVERLKMLSNEERIRYRC